MNPGKDWCEMSIIVADVQEYTLFLFFMLQSVDCGFSLDIRVCSVLLVYLMAYTGFTTRVHTTKYS